MIYPFSGGNHERDQHKRKEKTMCITPSHIWVERGPTHERIPVPCKNCWQCKANKVNDYIGRSLCEASTSDWTAAITLTYRPSIEREEDLAHKVIEPKHFQKFIRSLRDANHKIRYLAVAEFGSLRGRVHFHAILFGKGNKPKYLKGHDQTWPQQKNFHTHHWPHGHCFVDWTSEEKSLRYVCKYLLKNEKGKYWFTLSKKPTLGAEFFANRAEENGRLGVLPSTFEYLPPNGDRGRPYLVTGATRRDYLKASLKAYMGNRTFDRERLSEWVLKELERQEKLELKAYFEAMPAETQMEQLQHSIDLDRPNQRAVFACLWEYQKWEAEMQEAEKNPYPVDSQEYLLYEKYCKEMNHAEKQKRE